MNHSVWSAFVLTSLCIFVCCAPGCWCSDSSYENVDGLMQGLVLNNPGYNKYLRPLNNQSEAIVVKVSAQLLAVLEIDAVKQALTFNIFFRFLWTDERLTWDSNLYGQVDSLNFDYKDIWKPQFVMYLSESREVFKSDVSSILVDDTGSVVYQPGGVYQTFCRVDMTKFPFDKQECNWLICPIGYKTHQMTMEIAAEDLRTFQTLENEEFEVLQAGMTPITLPIGQEIFSCASVTMEFDRRPTYMLVNIVFPVVLLSFINILSFVIPVESGEKISFAITLLLSLTVYMTVVSDLVPRSSNNVPALTIYLFILLVNSVLAVVVTVIIVYFRLYEDKEQRYEDSKTKADEIDKKTNNLSSNNKVHHSESVPPSSNVVYVRETNTFREEGSQGENENPGAKQEYEDKGKGVASKAIRLVVEYGNIFSFVFFSALWAGSTIWYFYTAMA